MQEILSKLISQTDDYKSAEITCILLDTNKGKGEFINIFTIIELLPEEQLETPPIGNKEYPYNLRENVDEGTLYFIRYSGIPISEALEIFSTPQQDFNLSKDYLKVMVHSRTPLTLNPPKGNPLIIPKNATSAIRKILPARQTSYRVWSKIQLDKSYLAKFSSKFFSKLQTLSLQHLGYNLAALTEHLGNIYLVGCNPILRRWEQNLIRSSNEILIQFKERKGQSIIGGRMIIEEDRGGDIGFLVEKEIDDTNIRIPLPYHPGKLRIKIIDAKGRLLEYNTGSFINRINFNMEVGGPEINYSMKNTLTNEEKEFKVRKYTSIEPLIIQYDEDDLATYFKDITKHKQFEQLAAKRAFIFFPKSENSKNNAKEIVHELLNKARTRCMILDPYFGWSDLEYIFNISNTSIPIQVISSASYLTGRMKPKVQKMPEWQRIWNEANNRQWPRFLDILYHTVEKYNQDFPQQIIEIKVLRGKDSPLHDRYIIIDDDVYLLGSSLNEFGNRTTTIIKVPAPEPMIAYALKCWGNDVECPTIKALYDEKQ